MTLRVSRDGGRTWSATRTFTPRRGEVPVESALRYPPCRCPACLVAPTRSLRAGG